MAYQIVGVHIMSLPYHIDKEYEYYLPADFDQNISRGSFVIVPFGGGNKKMSAIVVSMRKDDDISKFKPVLSLAPSISLTPEQIGICYFLKEQIFCSIGDAVKAMIPSGALSKINEIYRALPQMEKGTELSQKALLVWDFIRQSKNGVSVERLVARFGKEVVSILPKLVEYSYAQKITEIKDGGHKKEIEIIHPKLSPEEAEDYISGEKKLRGSKRILILSYLSENGSCQADELCERIGVTKQQIKALCELGLIEIEHREILRTPYDIKIDEDRVSILSEHQSKAFEKISPLYSPHKKFFSFEVGGIKKGTATLKTFWQKETLSPGERCFLMMKKEDRQNDPCLLATVKGTAPLWVDSKSTALLLC